VEIMLCCAVLGTLSLVGVHLFQGLIPSARVNRAAHQIAALLEWTRWKALQEGATFKVVFDSDEESVKVYRENPTCNGEGEQQEVKRLELREIHDGVVLGAAQSTYRTSGCRYVQESGIHLRDDTVRFLPTGTSDRCGSVYLLPRDHLPDRQEHTVALSLLLSTGRIQLWSYDPIGETACTHGGSWNPRY